MANRRVADVGAMIRAETTASKKKKKLSRVLLFVQYVQWRTSGISNRSIFICFSFIQSIKIREKKRTRISIEIENRAPRGGTVELTHPFDVLTLDAIICNNLRALPYLVAAIRLPGFVCLFVFPVRGENCENIYQRQKSRFTSNVMCASIVCDKWCICRLKRKRSQRTI